MSYQDGLSQTHVSLDPLAALRSHATILLGVTPPVQAALASLGLHTVFDLATAPVFTLALQVGDAARGQGGGTLAFLNAVPGGAIVDGGPDSPETLATAPLSALRSLTPAQVAALEQQLSVQTVADLGRWLPFRSARAVLDAAHAPAGEGEDEARELVPRMGEFPTERRYYTTLVLDHVTADATVDLASAGPVDVAPSAAANFGFSAPAVGARLTFEQSWYAHGVTLGNLLHSVALAPGESTRIAVVDWSRRTTASATESIGETEALTNTSAHNRALSEVQNAVAEEVQTGFSHTESTAKTKESGGGFGFSAGPISVGSSGGSATTTTSADGFSTSVGSRELAASMSQQIMDSTQQAASSVRNRRASIVKEVSETEHESVSTRILANYNHMHALTVQYYEVIELYRVRAALSEVERCLFVPMKLVDFNDALIRRYQGALASAALTRRARELLTTEFGQVRVSPTAVTRPTTGVFGDLRSLTRSARMLSAPAADPDAPSPEPAPPAAPPPSETETEPAAFGWDLDELRRAARLTAAQITRPGTGDLFLPQEALLDGVSVSLEGAGPAVSAIRLRLQVGQPDVVLDRTSVGWLLSTPVPLQELAEIQVTTQAGSGRAQGSLVLQLTYRSAFFPVTLPLRVGAGTTATVARVGGSEVGPELIDHLRANRLHYSQAVWRSLDASTVSLLLSRFTFEGMPVANLIDPRPIQLAGNYLAFRMPGFMARPGLGLEESAGGADADTPEGRAQRAWREWLEARGLRFGRATATEQLVPVPTGGVFAEAVLGRSNSAEKLDATRFWNWQDSPIPLQPPEIAAINLASRAQPIDVQPGQLSQPVLNIVTPTSLPDPSGLGAMLGAIQNGGMFRDMSGLAAAIGLATSTASDATGAATDAAKLAAANLAVAAQKDIEQQKIAAQLAMAAMGNPAAMAGTPKSHSEMGALLNTVGGLDKVGAPGAGGGGAGSAAAGGGSGSGSGGTGTSGGGGSSGGEVLEGGGGGGGGGSASTLRDLAVGRALFGAVGAPAADLILADSRAGGGTATPPQFLTEINFYAKAVRGPSLDTVTKEVAALEAFTWRPSSVDFRAISIRSPGVMPAGAEVDSVGAFLRILAEPAARFNFFGYKVSGDGLSFQVTTGPGVLSAEPGTGVGDPGSPELGLGHLAALREVGSLSQGGGPMGELIRGVRKRNREYNDQHSRGRESAPVLRELWLALAVTPASDAFVQELAKALHMRVIAYPEEIVWRPSYQVTPPSISMRGRIELFGEKTSNLHDFDEQGVAFEP